MKNLTPNGIALRVSLLVAVVVTLTILLLNYFDSNLYLKGVFIFSSAFVISYLTFRIAVEKFIYKKIKVIYRTIHKLKLKKVRSEEHTSELQSH